MIWLLLLLLLDRSAPELKTDEQIEADAKGCALLIGFILWVMGYFTLIFQHIDQIGLFTLGYCLITALTLTALSYKRRK